jgi:hypothetical protein
MTDLFKYNPMPWAHVRCGDNWDIATPNDGRFPFGAGLSCFA